MKREPGWMPGQSTYSGNQRGVTERDGGMPFSRFRFIAGVVGDLSSVALGTSAKSALRGAKRIQAERGDTRPLEVRRMSAEHMASLAKAGRLALSGPVGVGDNTEDRSHEPGNVVLWPRQLP